MAENTDGDLQKIVVLMQAKDAEFRRAMDRNTMAMKRLSREGGYDMRKIRSEMKALDQQAKATAGAVGGWGKSFVAGMAGGVVTTLLGGISSDIAGVVKGIASIGDEAKRAGLGVEEFQEWKYVAEQNRIGIDALVDGFKELGLRADEYIVTGAGSAAEAFQRIGYSAADLRQKLKDPSALMLEIIDRLQRVDKAAQIRITDELFGGTGGEQLLHLLGMSTDQLQQMMARARDVGAVMSSEMVQKAADLDRRFSELVGRIGAVSKSAVLAVAGVAEQTFTALRHEADMTLVNLEKIARFRGQGVADDLADQPAAIEAEGAAIDDLSDRYDALAAAASEAARQLGMQAFALDVDGATELNTLVDAMHSLVQSYREGRTDGEAFAAQMDDLSAQASAAKSKLDGIDGVDMSGAVEAIGKLSRALSVAKFFADRLRAAIPGKVPWSQPEGGYQPDLGRFSNPYKTESALAPSTSPRPQSPGVDSYGDWLDARNDTSGGGGRGGGGGSKSEYHRATESIREQAAALEAEAVALLATAESGKDYGDAVQYARRYAELLTAAQEDGRDVTPELRAEIDQLAAAYVAAGEGAEAAREKLEAVRESAKRGEDVLIGIFESVLDGSRSAKDALGDLLMEMAKVQMRQAAMGAFGGSGIGSFLGSMLTPLAGARASGGSVVGGRPYLVNENTPNSEVFVPSQGGAILTSAQAQEALRARAVAPAAGRLGAEIRVKVYVEDDGTLAVVAEQHGARGAVPVVVEAIKKNNAQLAQAQRRK